MAIYKRGRGFELGTTENKSSKWPERDLNPGPPDCESDALTTRPRCPLGANEIPGAAPLQGKICLPVHVLYEMPYIESIIL